MLNLSFWLRRKVGGKSPHYAKPQTDLGKSPYKQITIPAKGFLQIDHMDDAGQLDFTTYYNIKIGDTEYIEQINGWSFSKEKMADIPILNETGYFSGFSQVGK